MEFLHEWGGLGLLLQLVADLANPAFRLLDVLCLSHKGQHNLHS